MTASSRRGKAIDTDGPTPKFLYAILKQLDLKSVRMDPKAKTSHYVLSILIANLSQVDWNLIASQLEISNGHAARMRYSRFRQQMEGTTGSRGSRAKKNPKKGQKGDAKSEMQKGNPAPSPMVFPKQEVINPSFQSNHFIKWESYPEFPDVSPYMIPEHSFLSYAPQFMPTSMAFPMAPPMLPQMSSSVTPSELSTVSPHPANEMHPANGNLHLQRPQGSAPATESESQPLSCTDEVPVKTEKEKKGETDDVIIKLEMPPAK